MYELDAKGYYKQSNDSQDVYSYPEDDSVLDPHLAQHLAHFGIDFSTMQKTEMTTAERELDQNTNFDWNRIQESGKELVPVFGPGYTGLVNLGNSYDADSFLDPFVYFKGGDIEKATDWIFNNPNASLSDMDVSSSSSAQTPAESALPDGGGRYKLFGIVSHMGTSTHCGHYVAHILKEGRWVIFNDSKVGISTNPPKDMGYLYFFQRLDN
ncbi:hypothetical protein F2Q70_00010217 [Brassica cretica]|uniref:USP domain-containing protein n=1 Tax=Brassica cretica TaxID=69181 RepID=A0A8S9M956_BRACR|nr:hypothetical protein F2Q70_00010217 [Brassica cretica]